MDSVINVVVSQFKTFAGNDGSSNTLNKEEFSSLVASQLLAFVKNTSDTGVIEQLIGSLDENNDRELEVLISGPSPALSTTLLYILSFSVGVLQPLFNSIIG
uniref:S100/CaBP-9k-type calcium binding subdomain domain-containing protein n=1 Tax=Oncorhynchus mykiss TaxID=8022 RepID=A0A8C7U6Q7_ONCMY